MIGLSQYFLYFSRTLLQFAKKKRKRSDSDDEFVDDWGETYEENRRKNRHRRGGAAADEDEDEVDSPKVDENVDRRRSSRSSKKKSYIDDTDYGLEEENDNALNEQIISLDTSALGSEAGTQPNSAAPSVLGHGGADPEVSNASTIQGSTVPGTPAENSNSVIDLEKSGPNYAFVVSIDKAKY